MLSCFTKQINISIGTYVIHVIPASNLLKCLNGIQSTKIKQKEKCMDVQCYLVLHFLLAVNRLEE
jgi:hypothetical protein